MQGDLAAHCLLETGEDIKFAGIPGSRDSGLEKPVWGRGEVPVILDEALVETTNVEDGAL